MKNQLKLILLFSVTLIYGQEKRNLISGKVFFNKIAISDVHVVNKNSNKGTNTNDSGWFEITVNKGDTIQISHINLQKKLILITSEIILKRKLNINLEERIEVLDEITLGKQKNMLYVEPSLYPAPVVNAKTLKLPFANSNVKKDDAIFKMESGAVVSLDNLINSLNGNNRRKKMLQKAKQEDLTLLQIRKQYTDDFFITDLKIKKENINRFLNYCFKKKVIYFYKSKKHLKLTKILVDESKKFTQNIEIDSLILTKK